MAWICGKCERICEQIEVDQGGYEEWWGAEVWMPCITDVSECCEDDAHTLKDWIENGWDIPDEFHVLEAFYDEGILQRGPV
jgi:hypothetical protein